MSILDEIFAHKRNEVAARKLLVPEKEIEIAMDRVALPPNFAAALRNESRPAPRLIAEVKHKSPSKGVLCPDFDPLMLAKTYAENGAAAISVLTDEKYFGGSLDYLKLISEHFSSFQDGREGTKTLPVGKAAPLLRKDFIFERYQLLEARAAGASAALLIVAMLTDLELTSLIKDAEKLDLTPLVEVHTKTELNRALDNGALVIGINNRDLHTFTVNLETTLELRKFIPDEITIVAESGIKTLDDVHLLAEAGVHAMLIGEGIVTAEDRGVKVRELAQMEPVLE